MDRLLDFVTSKQGDLTFADEYLVNLYNKTSDIKLVKFSEIPIRVYGNTFMFNRDSVNLRDIFNDVINKFKKAGKLNGI